MFLSISMFILGLILLYKELIESQRKNAPEVTAKIEDLRDELRDSSNTADELRKANGLLRQELHRGMENRIMVIEETAKSQAETKRQKPGVKKGPGITDEESNQMEEVMAEMEMLMERIDGKTKALETAEKLIQNLQEHINQLESGREQKNAVAVSDQVRSESTKFLSEITDLKKHIERDRQIARDIKRRVEEDRIKYRL